MVMADKARVAAQFIQAIPHAKALGLELLDIDAGKATISMPYNDRLIGDPESGVVHGGAVSAMLDTCCGAAVIAHPDNPGITATIDLRIDYMRAATPGQTIVTHAHCHHLTRSVAFVSAVAHDDNADMPVARAEGSFTVDTGK